MNRRKNGFSKNKSDPAEETFKSPSLPTSHHVHEPNDLESKRGSEPQATASEQNTSEQISRRLLLKSSLAAVGMLAAKTTATSAESSDRVQRRKSEMTDAKRIAICDYQQSMKQFGGSLSSPIQNLLYAEKNNAPYQIDIAVIGSGYGASICAARLAGKLKKGGRLCMIERGKEWVPGTFADTLKGARSESRYELTGNDRMSMSNPLGLINMVQNEEVNVLSGSGLGGTSLINANVALRADPAVFNIAQWPAALRDRHLLDPYYDIAGVELGIQTAVHDGSHKVRAQRLAAERLYDIGGDFQLADLAVTLNRKNLDAAGRNRHGMYQQVCHNCGDCTAGCNVGAKNTLNMNYIPLARKNGAEIYTQTEVVTIQKMADHYRVYVKHYVPRDEGVETIYGMFTARVVILGAGSLGSTEILLRSWAAGFEFSNKVGWNWTGNGDALGFVLKSDNCTNIGGFGAYAHDRAGVGPTIQSNLKFSNHADFRKHVLIQDGAIARSYANAAGILMRDPDLQSTMVLLGMGHDGGNGRIVLRDGGHGQVKWPGLKEEGYRKFIRAHFKKVADAHGGKYKYLKNIWRQLHFGASTGRL